MANIPLAGALIAELASEHRVIMLGGLAVISHGLDRVTYDGDVWLDANLSPRDWAKILVSFVERHPVLEIVRIAHWSPIVKEELPDFIENDGVVRINGANQPLDVFRKPNEIDVESFDEIWQRAKPMKDGTRLPDVVDLLLTKQLTGRAKDNYDIAFLEGKAESYYIELLPKTPPPEAVVMLERFLTPKVAVAAAMHPDLKVQEIGRLYLQELVDLGDPYAAEFMREMS